MFPSFPGTDWASPATRCTATGQGRHPVNRCWRTGQSQARNPPPSYLAPPPVAPEVNKGRGGGWWEVTVQSWASLHNGMKRFSSFAWYVEDLPQHIKEGTNQSSITAAVNKDGIKTKADTQQFFTWFLNLFLKIDSWKAAKKHGKWVLPFCVQQCAAQWCHNKAHVWLVRQRYQIHHQPNVFCSPLVNANQPCTWSSNLTQKRCFVVCMHACVCVHTSMHICVHKCMPISCVFLFSYGLLCCCRCGIISLCFPLCCSFFLSLFLFIVINSKSLSTLQYNKWWHISTLLQHSTLHAFLGCCYMLLPSPAEQSGGHPEYALTNAFHGERGPCVFGGFVSISGGWVLLCKGLMAAEGSPHITMLVHNKFCVL